MQEQTQTIGKQGLLEERTPGGKPLSRFTMMCVFYGLYTNKETGEVTQGKFTYRGWHERNLYAKKGLRFESDLDALKHKANEIANKCERIIFYDNQRGAGAIAEIGRIEKGAVVDGCLLGNYPNKVKLHITKHKF